MEQMDDASDVRERVAVGNPDRPLPPRRAAEVVSEWIALIGPARMAVAGLSALAVVAAAAWLLRAGPPATEASLALADGSVPVATLASVPTSRGTSCGLKACRRAAMPANASSSAPCSVEGCGAAGSEVCF